MRSCCFSQLDFVNFKVIKYCKITLKYCNALCIVKLSVDKHVILSFTLAEWTILTGSCCRIVKKKTTQQHTNKFSYERSPEPSETSLPNRRGSDVKKEWHELCSYLNTWCFGVNSSLKRVINIHRDKALVSRRKRIKHNRKLERLKRKKAKGITTEVAGCQSNAFKSRLGDFRGEIKKHLEN